MAKSRVVTHGNLTTTVHAGESVRTGLTTNVSRRVVIAGHDAKQTTILATKDGPNDVTIRVSGGGSGVISFNGRTGVVTLLADDVTGALGYSPVNPKTNTLANLADVSLHETQNGDVVAYNTPTAKWTNLPQNNITDGGNF